MFHENGTCKRHVIDSNDTVGRLLNKRKNGRYSFGEQLLRSLKKKIMRFGGTTFYNNIVQLSFDEKIFHWSN